MMKTAKNMRAKAIFPGVNIFSSYLSQIYTFMTEMKRIITFLLIFSIKTAFCSQIEDAYKALSIYDYFKAKQLFYKSISKKPCHASFGLATIYYRTDNPFSNVDSAAKYIAICSTQFKDTISYSTYHINSNSIYALAQLIAQKGFQKYCSDYSVDNINHFLKHFYFANDSLLSQSFDYRDQKLVEYYLSYQSSDSLNTFLQRYPESSLYSKAKKQYFNFQYHENVDESNAAQLKTFIKQFSHNPNVFLAETKLFELTKQLHLADSLNSFIEKYSTAQTKEDAWKALYSESVKGYNAESLSTFLTKYPNYPYSESIIKEINLSQHILFPLKSSNEDYYGYVDTLGNWVIKPVYSDAMPFAEGYAAVCKNDSCYYIDKAGHKVFELYFDEAENYKNGIAIVKKETNYFLLNRSGQIISKGYQDIGEASNGLYVCQYNNLYGAINSKGEINIPFSYHKLGNFKNGYAYYLSKAYGLVDIYNETLKAQWDWVSDVDSNLMVIVKKNNKFGIMNLSEKLLLPAEYDYIAACPNNIYLVVKNNLYGFFNIKENCFVTSIDYAYNQAYESNYYSDGKYFTLVKNNEVALTNTNGKQLINFGTFANVFLTNNELMRVQRNNKFGFIDKKLKPITPIEFDIASNYENGLAIVSKNGLSQLINTQGKSLYSIKGGFIYPLNNFFYKTSLNELVGLISNKGEVLLNSEYTTIETIDAHLLRCKKTDGLYLYNAHTKTLKKI